MICVRNAADRARASTPNATDNMRADPELGLPAAAQVAVAVEAVGVATAAEDAPGLVLPDFDPGIHGQR